jgi:hypothetical protein
LALVVLELLYLVVVSFAPDLLALVALKSLALVDQVQGCVSPFPSSAPLFYQHYFSLY